MGITDDDLKNVVIENFGFSSDISWNIINENIPAMSLDSTRVVKQIESGERTYMNDHSGWFGSKNTEPEKIEGVAILEDGEIVLLCRSTYFSINRLYVSGRDDKIHLSCSSIGGVVIGDNINQYNESVSQNMKINRYVYFN